MDRYKIVVNDLKKCIDTIAKKNVRKSDAIRKLKELYYKNSCNNSISYHDYLEATAYFIILRSLTISYVIK